MAPIVSRKQPFTLAQFKNIYSQVPRICVDLVIKTDKGTLLTLRQDNGWIGKWHLPGGTIHLNEPVVDAISRIAQEELSVQLRVIKLLGYVEYPSEKKERGYGYSISLAFLCQPLSETVILDDQAGTYRFFNKLPENIISEQKQFLQDHNLT